MSSTFSPGKPLGVLAGDERRVLQTDEKGWRAFDGQSGEFRPYLVGSRGFKRLFQKILPETISAGSMMGRLEGLQYQNKNGLID